MDDKKDYKPPERLSPSSVGTFRQCPLRYRLSRLDGIPEPSTQEQLRGSFVHEILEHLFMAEPADRTMAQARKIASELWNATWQEEVSSNLHLSERDMRAWRWHAWWCVEEYFNLEEPSAIQPAGLETRLEGKVAGVPFVGIIDRWLLDDSGNATITDYKTGKAPSERYAADKIFQIMVYADMLADQQDVAVDTVELIYLKNPGKKAQYQPTNTQLNKMRQTVETVWESIRVACETNSFEPKPSRLCDWCHYKSICPAFNNER